jgi:hypothetical protein
MLLRSDVWSEFPRIRFLESTLRAFHLQAQGIEIGLVAKIAGHANPTVTLGHYTQAVRGGEAAATALEQAYAAGGWTGTRRGAQLCR